MMRYFFHSVDGQFVCDEEGVELADVAEAMLRATHEARILASESILSNGRLLMKERIDITDMAGHVVATVSVRDAIAIED